MMKKGFKILGIALLLMALPLLCGYLWGLHEANIAVTNSTLSPSETEKLRARIVSRWTGGGMLWGMILLGYAVMMRLAFWVIGMIVNACFRLARKRNKLNTKEPDAR